MRIFRFFLPALLAGLIAACSSSSPSEQAGSGSWDLSATCSSDADCGGGVSMCLFARADGCSTAGHCYTPAGGTVSPQCLQVLRGCACGGGDAVAPCAAPSGYASKPVQASCASGG